MKKLLNLILILFILQNLAFSKQNDSIKTALLIVDIQDFYFPGEGPGLHNAIPVSLKAKEVLQNFREKKQLVVHIRHLAEKGFDIHKNVAPFDGEKIITKKYVNSFQNTDLLTYLKTNNINRIVIIGMQTQMCVEAATRAGADLGFECVLIHDACATRDVTYAGKTVKADDVQTSTLATIKDGGYAKIIDVKSFKKDIDKYLFQKLD